VGWGGGTSVHHRSRQQSVHVRLIELKLNEESIARADLFGLAAACDLKSDVHRTDNLRQGAAEAEPGDAVPEELIVHLSFRLHMVPVLGKGRHCHLPVARWASLWSVSACN